MNHKQGRLAALLIGYLEHALVTHYEGPNVDNIAVAKAELHILSLNVLYRHST